MKDVTRIEYICKHAKIEINVEKFKEDQFEIPTFFCRKCGKEMLRTVVR